VRDEGVRTIPNSRVTAVSTSPAPSNPNAPTSNMTLTLDSGDTVTADEVIVAVGIKPNTELAQLAHLEIDTMLGGIVVNAELEARTDVWVAGDVASFYDVTLGRRQEEHHDHAVVSGRLAGGNMAGGRKAYGHQSMFWSDLGPEIGYEAIGLVDAKLPTIGIWAAASGADTPQAAVKGGSNIRAGILPSSVAAEAAEQPGKPADAIDRAAEEPAPVTKKGYGKGVVFYMRDNAVVGVVTWNIFNKMPLARKIIRSQKKYRDPNELAKLFKIHEEDEEH